MRQLTELEISEIVYANGLESIELNERMKFPGYSLALNKCGLVLAKTLSLNLTVIELDNLICRWGVQTLDCNSCYPETEEQVMWFAEWVDKYIKEINE